MPKAAVDLVEEWNKVLVVWHLRNGLVAFLGSPIVFLGFLYVGKFDGSEQTFLVLLMLAFQNGFLANDSQVGRTSRRAVVGPNAGC